MPGKNLSEQKSEQQIINFIEQDNWNIDIVYEDNFIPFSKYFEKGDERSETKGWVNRSIIRVNGCHEIWSDIILESTLNWFNHAKVEQHKTVKYRLNVGAFTGNGKYDDVNFWHYRCVTEDARSETFAQNEWALVLDDVRLLLQKVKGVLLSESKQSFPEMLDHVTHFKRNIIWRLPGKKEYHLHYLNEMDSFRFILYDAAGDDIGCTMYANGAGWTIAQHELESIVEITDETLFKQVATFIIENKIIDAKVIIENEKAYIFGEHGTMWQGRICETDDIQVIKRTLLP